MSDKHVQKSVVHATSLLQIHNGSNTEQKWASWESTEESEHSAVCEEQLAQHQHISPAPTVK